MNARPGLLRRIDSTGLPSLSGRLILGMVLISMGLAKTGTLDRIVKKTGLSDSPAIQRLADPEGGVIALADPIDFLKVIREYRLVPNDMYVMRNALAASLPWLEVLCGLLLVLGVAVRGTSLFMLATLIGFTIIVTIRAMGVYEGGGLAFCDIKFDCGCGAGEVYICNKIAENAVLCLLALVVLLSRSRRLCLRPNLIPLRPSQASPGMAS